MRGGCEFAKIGKKKKKDRTRGQGCCSFETRTKWGAGIPWPAEKTTEVGVILLQKREPGGWNDVSEQPERCEKGLLGKSR